MATLAEIKAMAKEYAKKKQYDKAIALLEKVIKKKTEYGSDARFLNEIGELSLSDGQLDKAADYFSKAIEFYTNDYFYPQAIALCKKVLRIKTEEYTIYKKMGELYVKTVNIGEAVKNYEMFIKYAKNRKLTNDVYNAYKSLITVVPKRYEFKYELIDYYLENGDEESARNELILFKKYLEEKDDKKEIDKLIKKFKKVFPEIENIVQEEGEDENLADLLMSAMDKIESKKEEKRKIVESIVAENEEHLVEEELKEEFKEEKIEEKEIKKPKKKKQVKEEKLGIERGEAEFATIGKGEKSEESVIEEKKEIEETIGEIEIEEKDEIEGEHLTEAEKEQIRKESKSEYKKKAMKKKMEKESAISMDIIESSMDEVSFEEISPEIDNHIKDVLGDYKAEESSITTSTWDEYMDLAGLSESLGDDEQAYRYYIEAADGFYDEGIYDKSKIAYEKSFKINPDNLKPLKKMADICIKLGKNKEATDLYIHLSDNLEKHGAHKEAEKMKQKANNLGLVKGVEKEIDLNKILSEEDTFNDIDVNVNQISEVINRQVEKGDFSAHYDLGISYKEMGMYEMAINEFKSAMRGKTEQLKSLDMLAICHIEIGRYSTAENIFKKALSLPDRSNEEYAGISFNLGQLYEQEKQYVKAMELYRKTKSLGGKFPGIEKKIKNMEDNLKTDKKSGKKTIKKNKITYI
jgi:tetratricopeptide (TPR) repeat protein